MALLPSKTGIRDLTRHLMRLNISSRNYGSSTDTVKSPQILGSHPLFNSNSETFCPSIHQRPQSLLLGRVTVRLIYTKRVNIKVQRKKYKDDKTAVECYGFTYFPRFPNHEDPPVEPTKLFMVKRVRSVYGCPWWEKLLMRSLKLEDRRSVAIVKNTPANNAKLYKVKHLIEITPITTPHGLPDKPENGFLNENGELIFFNPLSLHGENLTIEDAEKQSEKFNEMNLKGDILKERLRQRWNSKYDIV